MNNETQHTALLPWSTAKQRGTKGHCHAAQIFDVTGKAIIMIEPTVNAEDANRLLDYVASAPSLLKENQELKADLELVRKSWKADTEQVFRLQSINEKLIKALEKIQVAAELAIHGGANDLHQFCQLVMMNTRPLLSKSKTEKP
jgi:hypothetical protein